MENMHVSAAIYAMPINQGIAYGNLTERRAVNGLWDVRKDRRAAALLTQSEHDRMRDHFLVCARHVRACYVAAVSDALTRFGDHDSLISGVIRDHFPDYCKHALRLMAHGITTLEDLALWHHSAARRRIGTFRVLLHKVQS